MEESQRMIFSGMQILIEDNWKSDHAVIVEGRTIKAIIPVNMIEHHLPAKQHHFPANHYLAPGFIDLHVHGAHGKDVMDATAESLQEISRTLAAEGVTSFLATTMTAPNNQIENVITAVVNHMSDAEGAAILGLHLEGPFLSIKKIGAQYGEYIQLPNIELIQHWQDLAKGAIKIVTLAPELPGAIELIKKLKQMTVIASIGHTNATYAETSAAITAGCTQATHLFNAMREIHQREPGTAAAILLADTVNAEIIVDGIHLHPILLQLILRLKDRDRLLLVTDAMRAKCMCDGDYELGGQTVSVSEGRATLADGTLAGSTLRMPTAIKNMMEFTKCTLPQAIAMASKNPARVLNLSQTKGSITVGKDADLVIMNEALHVKMTIRSGKIVYES